MAVESLPRPVAAVSVVTLCQGSVLMVQRGKEPYRGKWSFPGGAIEPGEPCRAAARREALEETGIEVEVLDVADVIDSIHPPSDGRPGYHYCLISFLAVPSKASRHGCSTEVDVCGDTADAPAIPCPLAASDASDARWVPLDETDQYDLTPLAEAVLERAVRRYAECVRSSG